MLSRIFWLEAILTVYYAYKGGVAFYSKPRQILQSTNARLQLFYVSAVCFIYDILCVSIIYIVTDSAYWAAHYTKTIITVEIDELWIIVIIYAMQTPLYRLFGRKGNGYDMGCYMENACAMYSSTTAYFPFMFTNRQMCVRLHFVANCIQTIAICM